MKSGLLFPFLLIIVTSCLNKDSSIDYKSQIEEIVTWGTWRITYYYDTDKEETSNYAGYNFTFSASLTATNGTNTYTGSWSITDNGSNDDSPELHFNIAFSSPPAFEKLSDDWEIVEATESKITLRDVSGGGGGTDYLTFELNQ